MPGNDSNAPKPLQKSDTFCRNISIYGFCRYADSGCMYSHEVKKPTSAAIIIKHPNDKRLNADSPTFTPATISKASSTKGSPLVASAKIWHPKPSAGSSPFKPASRGAANGTSNGSNNLTKSNQPNGVPNPFGSPEFNPYRKNDFTDFHPPNFNDLNISNGSHYQDQNYMNNNHGRNDPFMPSGQDMTAATVGLYTSQPAFQQQGPQWHLYAPVGPYPENLQLGQKRLRDFFIPDDLRETVQKRMEACHKNLPDSALLPQFDKWHSLLPLDTSISRTTSGFEFPSWIYRATSSDDGRFYALRRIDGALAAEDKANRTINMWKRIESPYIVRVHGASKTSAFGDSSLIIVTDFHPCSRTLADEVFSAQALRGRKPNFANQIPEQVLSTYLVQLASATHTVHTFGMAVRNFEPSKILVTDTNHIRLNGCTITDALQQGYRPQATELMMADFHKLGILMLKLGTRNPNAGSNLVQDMNHFSKFYGARLRELVTWLVTPQTREMGLKTAAQFLEKLAPEMNSVLTMTAQAQDQTMSRLGREIENGRLLRLIFKLNVINERPEYETAGSGWSEKGDRYILKLFRDYVWHQVDENGNPVLNMGHIVACMSKLDVGTEELVKLVSRDEQTCVIVSYAELRRAVRGAFAELQNAERPVS